MGKRRNVFSPLAVYIYRADFYRVLTMDDVKLVAAAKAGDMQAFMGLIRRYHGALIATAEQITGNAEDAEDIAQEVIIHTYLNLYKLREDEKFRAWFFTICRRECSDYLHRHHIEVQPLEACVELPARTTDEETGYWELISQLPLASREILLARYFYDLSYTEMAAIFDSTASVQLQSSTTPGDNTVTAVYTDSNDTPHQATNHVTFFTPSLQFAGAVPVPGANVPPLDAIAVGAVGGADTVSVTIATTPTDVDLSQLQINWGNSDGIPDPDDPTGDTRLLSNAPTAPNIANVTAVVKASVTTQNCPGQLAVVSVTSVKAAAGDGSGLQEVDENGNTNLVTSVQAGKVATAQANFTPDIAALQSICNQLITWSSGSAGATGDLRGVPCDTAVESILRASCGSSSATAIVWVASLELSVAGVNSSSSAVAEIPLDNGTTNGVSNLNQFPVPGDRCLVPVTLSVEPSGLGGNVALTYSAGLGIYTASDKYGGPDTELELGPVAGRCPPRHPLCRRARCRRSERHAEL